MISLVKFIMISLIIKFFTRNILNKENYYISTLAELTCNILYLYIPNLTNKFTKATNFYLKQENGSNNQQQPEQPSPIAALQSNSKRPSETTPQELLPKSNAEQGTGSRSQSPSNPIPRAARNVGQSSNGQGDLFSTNAGILET